MSCTGERAQARADARRRRRPYEPRRCRDYNSRRKKVGLRVEVLNTFFTKVATSEEIRKEDEHITDRHERGKHKGAPKKPPAKKRQGDSGPNCCAEPDFPFLIERKDLLRRAAPRLGCRRCALLDPVVSQGLVYSFVRSVTHRVSHDFDFSVTHGVAHRAAHSIDPSLDFGLDRGIADSDGGSGRDVGLRIILTRPRAGLAANREAAAEGRGRRSGSTAAADRGTAIASANGRAEVIEVNPNAGSDLRLKRNGGPMVVSPRGVFDLDAPSISCPTRLLSDLAKILLNTNH